MSIKRNNIQQYLAALVQQYERLEAERNFLRDGVAARLAVVNAERQEVVAEAQEQLDRLNVIRVAAGEEPMTLQEVRNQLSQRGPARRQA